MLLTGLFLVAAVAVTLVLGLTFLGIKIPFVSRYVPVNRRTAGILAVAAFVFIAWDQNLIMQFFQPATVGPTAEVVAVEELVATCGEGLDATQTLTVYFDVYDRQSDSESKISGSAPLAVYGSDGTKYVDIDDAAPTSATIPAGTVLSIYGGNGSYYVEAKENICVDKSGMRIELDGHAIQTEANMQVTAYDDTEVTTLTAGDTSYQEDYELDMGANDEQSIFIKLKNNAADAGFWLGAIGIIEQNSSVVDSVTLQEDGWSAGIVRDYQDVTVYLEENASGGANLSTEGYDKVMVASTPILMDEWDSIKYEYVIKTGSTAPTEVDTAGQSGEASVTIYHFDVGWAEGSDGNMYFDYYTHKTTEGNPGLSESLTSPIGKELGCKIELK